MSSRQSIKISELTLMGSFRYALGRRSYVVAEVVEDILQNWDVLSEKAKNKMHEEIREAIKNDNFGDHIDFEQWTMILHKR